MFKVAVSKMTELSEALLAPQRPDRPADVDLFIPHQANKRIILATAERLGMPEEKIVINIGEYRQYDRRDDSAGDEHRARTRAVEEGDDGVAGGVRRRIYDRGDAAALGIKRGAGNRSGEAAIAASPLLQGMEVIAEP